MRKFETWFEHTCREKSGCMGKLLCGFVRHYLIPEFARELLLIEEGAVGANKTRTRGTVASVVAHAIHLKKYISTSLQSLLNSYIFCFTLQTKITNQQLIYHPLELIPKKKKQTEAKARSSLFFMSHYRYSTRMIWRIGWIDELTLGGMDASEKRTIIQFTPYQTTTLPK